MAKINAAWHQKHRMPKGATFEQRVRWHLAHARACGCREMPPTILRALRDRGLATPKARKRGRAL